MYCEKCGQQVTGRYCENCGHDNDPQDIYNYETGNLKYKPITRNSMPTWLKVILVFVGLGLLGKFLTYATISANISPENVVENLDDPVDVFTIGELKNYNIDYSIIEPAKSGCSFRTTKWGMSSDEVIKSETATYKESDDVSTCLFSKVYFAKDFNVPLIYSFKDEKLFRAVLLKDYELENYKDCYNQYTYLKSELDSFYDDNSTRNGDEDVVDPKLEDEFASYYEWTKDDTRITLMLIKKIDY